MASRSSRTSARGSTPASARPQQRSPSPLSPTKIRCRIDKFSDQTFDTLNRSRTEEKKVLGQLNSRLAAYIEKVRSLELENGRLEQQVNHLRSCSMFVWKQGQQIFSGFQH